MIRRPIEPLLTTSLLLLLAMVAEEAAAAVAAAADAWLGASALGRRVIPALLLRSEEAWVTARR